jgi:predicted kinase
MAITHGLSGSGKSTVAARLVEASGAVRLRSDVERKRLFGLAPEQRSRAGEAAALYSTDMSRKTFDRLAELAEAVLEAGFPVIVDGTFLHRHVRDDFRQRAQRLNTPFAILACVADVDDIRTRLVAREQGTVYVSEAGVEVMEQQKRQIEPPAGEELEFVVEVNSGWDASEIWNALRQQLA